MPDPRIRKNIDDLTEDELSNYEHALKQLIAISANDPESIDGYTYFEQLHDGDKGPCEHANDTFLPWHRAQLYLFEEALRRSDPPRTSNVTIPYWDWSALPTGSRYPKRFEDPASPLFHIRNTDPICKNPPDGRCLRLPFPREHLEQNVLSISAWSSPAPANPNETPDPNFGGVAGGESQCQSPFGPGFGALEQPAHNFMHGSYIGGDMADPSAAALDPIFWSFHAYIDLIWWQWQQIKGHTENTGLSSRLCGLFNDREHKPENRFRVTDVLDTVNQLNYTYDFTRRPGPTPLSISGQLFTTHPAVDFVLSGRKDPEIVRSIAVKVPKPGFIRARLNLTGVHVTTPLSYGADFYLVPAEESFRPRDVKFRERYLISFLYMWKVHHHGAHGGHGGHNDSTRTHNIAVDVTRALRELAQSRDQRAWKVWIAVAADTMSEAPTRVLAAVDTTGAAMKMDFRDITLAVE